MVIYVLQLFVSEVVTSKILKLTLSFLSSHFSTRPKSQDKNLNIFRTKRAFKVKWKAFFIIFKELSFAKYCLRPESAPLSQSTKPFNWKWFNLVFYLLTLTTKWQIWLLALIFVLYLPICMKFMKPCWKDIKILLALQQDVLT